MKKVYVRFYPAAMSENDLSAKLQEWVDRGFSILSVTCDSAKLRFVVTYCI